MARSAMVKHGMPVQVGAVQSTDRGTTRSPQLAEAGTAPAP